MDLYIFPEAACLNNGYGIGVDYAYKRLCPSKSDVVVWYTILEKEDMMYLKDKDVIIKKNQTISVKSICNILFRKDRTECSYKDLAFLKGMVFEHIHCDEVIFYRSIRKLFPAQQMTVRLHNCFARIYDRKQMLGLRLDWKYEIKLRNMYRLEREIFRDNRVHKIFISDEDRDYYTANFGRFNDSESWLYLPNLEKANNSRKIKPSYTHKLVWYGGIESHKKASITWFIEHVLEDIRKQIPDVEFHLWGRGSLAFNDPNRKIFGYGFFDGEGFPMENSLYVNPDIIGGGIKLKLMTFIENGIPFISTPFGFEGYSKELIDNVFCIVEEQENWVKRIIDIIK